MCGRYLFYDEKNQKIRRLIQIAETVLDPVVFSSVSLHDVYPSAHAFSGIYDPRASSFHSTIMKWGMTLKQKDVINARSETFRTSPFFAETKPCVLLCSGYYEWSKEHQKYYFSLEHDAMYLAGLYTFDGKENVYTILTEEACGKQAEIHPRQPIVLNEKNAQEWCADIRFPVHEHSIAERLQTKSE